MGHIQIAMMCFYCKQWEHDAGKISTDPVLNAKLIDGLELQVLADFSPDQTWDLMPGDMLYLPPHFAHHGVALNDCMTFSIGFRAPSSADLMDALTNTIIEQGLGANRYCDLDLRAGDNSSEIDSDAVKRLKQLLHETIDNAEPALAETLGKLVTETKSTLTALASQTSTDLPSVDEIDTEFKQGNSLQRSPYHRFAWMKDDSKVQLLWLEKSIVQR
ncbi:MAG: cupin domain-containing protein [Gammaproteobacteria bacterium]|nr:cupin domain-containing protein [Gammaproteobacteria bacterium]